MVSTGSLSSSSIAEVRFCAIVLAQPRLYLWQNGQPEPRLSGQTTLFASRPLKDAELQTAFVPAHLKTTDVPRTLSAGHMSYEPQLGSWYQGQGGDLGRLIQYVFSDGLILTANEILRHHHATLVPRALWPLLMNIPEPLRGEHGYTLHGARAAQGGLPSTWLRQTEATLLAVLLNASRLAKRDGFQILFTQNEDRSVERRAVELQNVEIGNEPDARWIFHTHFDFGRTGESGRGQLRLEFRDRDEPVLRTCNFSLWTESRTLRFHSLWAQAAQVRSALQAGPGQLSPAAGAVASEMANPIADEIPLSGHANIQTALRELQPILDAAGLGPVEVRPSTIDIESAEIVMRLLADSNHALRVSTHLRLAPGHAIEIAGLPPASAYLLQALSFGIGATTGLANSQIAYKRRGIKRDRDMKVLKHLGFAAMIVLEAANFALGLPLSDGTPRPGTIEELLRTLYARLGSLILKGEGWPVQTGSLETLCSSNVTSLIDGFIRQIVRDCDETSTNLYLPQGELRLQGFSRRVVAFYRALVADLVQMNGGSVFERARTKSFEGFVIHSGQARSTALAAPADEAPDAAREMRESAGGTGAVAAEGTQAGPGAEPAELLVFRAPSDNPLAQAFQIGPTIPVYLLPEPSRPPRGAHLFALAGHGIQVFYDGRIIETMDIADFRPEFELREDASPVLQNDTRHIDWFELHPKFFFKGTEIPAEQAARLSREGVLEFQGRLYRLRTQDLPSIERLKGFWSNIQSGPSGGPGRKRKTGEPSYYVLPKSQTLELLALRASGVKITGGARWQRVCEFYDALDQRREPPQLPPSFRATLKAYQQAGVRWLKDLFDLGLGGILADDMGLGKTVTTLAFLELLRAEKRMGPCLVVVPTSLTYNWLSESERFAPELGVRIFQSRAQEELLDFVRRTPDCIVVTTYGLLQENSGWFGQTRWNVIVFDEAQNLKNLGAKRTTAARKLEGGFKVCLTGTPLENHFGEFYSLFDLVLPGALGELTEFRDRFINPPAILKDDIRHLRAKARPCLLRRTKAQVMQELPPKIETTVKLPFEPEQKRIYRDIATSYNEKIRDVIAAQGETRSQLQMLTALLRLRQACSDPSSIPNVRYNGEPPKLGVLIEALTEIIDSGESALVFTQFLTTFARIKRELARVGLTHFEISGGDARQVREKRLQAFREAEKGAVLLMTLKTGGVGLNLTKASYVFHIEPWWNPAVENQATDRAHRIGQEKPVQVYRYIIRDSVEEKIETLKEIKGQRFDALFGTTENAGEIGAGNAASGHLTQKDFEYLLG